MLPPSSATATQCTSVMGCCWHASDCADPEGSSAALATGAAMCAIMPTTEPPAAPPSTDHTEGPAAAAAAIAPSPTPACFWHIKTQYSHLCMIIDTRVAAD